MNGWNGPIFYGHQPIQNQSSSSYNLEYKSTKYSSGNRPSSILGRNFQLHHFVTI